MNKLVVLACALALGLLGACASMEDGKKSGEDSAKMAKKEMAKKAAPAKKKKKKKLPASGSPFTVYFKLNSIDLTDSSQGDLFDIMQKVRVYKPKTVVVEVHSDLTGTSQQNKLISEKRGSDLAAKLKSAGAKVVVTEIIGDAQPIVDTKKASQANRRAIISFKKK